MKKNKFILLGGIGTLMLLFAFAVTPSVFADTTNFTQMTGNPSLQIGSESANVTSLQQFLRSNVNIYPAGLVTGFFGPLTAAAVTQYQLSYNIGVDGIAGPVTQNNVNNVIGVGKGIDLSAPVISNLTALPSGRNVSFAFNSNKPVKTTVFYDTKPIILNNWYNSGAASLAIPGISGTESTDSSFSLNKQFTLNNLSAGSLYYYTVTATDQSGNTSITWPSTFVTGQ